MPSMRSSAAAFTVALLCAAFGSAAHAARAPGDQAARVAASPREIGVYLDHVMVGETADPREIIPCVRVFRPVLNESRRNPSLSVTLELSWNLEDGTAQHASFTIPLSSFERTEHHADNDGAWVLADTLLVLHSEPAGEVTGTAVLNERGAVPTAVRIVPGS
jgi:hypothetical protein